MSQATCHPDGTSYEMAVYIRDGIVGCSESDLNDELTQSSSTGCEAYPAGGYVKSVCEPYCIELGCGCGEPAPSGCDEQCGSTKEDVGCGCGLPATCDKAPTVIIEEFFWAEAGGCDASPNWSRVEYTQGECAQHGAEYVSWTCADGLDHVLHLHYEYRVAQWLVMLLMVRIRF